MHCPRCETELVKIDMGPRLMYDYCRTCKKELDVIVLEMCTPDHSNDYTPDMDDVFYF